MRKFTYFIAFFLLFSIFFLPKLDSQNISGRWKAFDNISVNGENLIHEIEIRIYDSSRIIQGIICDKILGTKNYKISKIRGNYENGFYWITSTKTLSSSLDTYGLSSMVMKLSYPFGSELSGLVTSSDKKHNLYFNQGSSVSFKKRNEINSVAEASDYRDFIQEIRGTFKEASVSKKTSKPIKKKPIRSSISTSVQTKLKANPRISAKSPKEKTKQTPVKNEEIKKTTSPVSSKKTNQEAKKNDSNYEELIFLNRIDSFNFDTTEFVELDENPKIPLPPIPTLKIDKSKKNDLMNLTNKKFKKQKKYLDFKFEVEDKVITLILAPIDDKKPYDTVSVYLDKELISFYQSIDRLRLFKYPIRFKRRNQTRKITLVSESPINQDIRNSEVYLVGENMEYRVELTPYKKINNQVNLKFVPVAKSK